MEPIEPDDRIPIAVPFNAEFELMLRFQKAPAAIYLSRGCQGCHASLAVGVLGEGQLAEWSGYVPEVTDIALIVDEFGVLKNGELE